MSATDVSDTLQVALRGSGLNQVKVLHRPRLLSDNGLSYVSSELGKWLEDNGIRHLSGRPYHPMTQGKIERYHRAMKNRILLDNYYLPGQLEQSIQEFVSYYNNCRYHESLHRGAGETGERWASRQPSGWIRALSLCRAIWICGRTSAVSCSTSPGRGEADRQRLHRVVQRQIPRRMLERALVHEPRRCAAKMRGLA